MPNQVVSLTYPQRLAQLLQSTDQNNLLGSPQMPQQSAGGGYSAPGLGDMMAMKKMMTKQPTPMTPGDMQAANLRDYEDMTWGM